jgi:hypothetical protein
MRKEEVGYIASISLAPSGKPGRPMPHVIVVIEEPGSTAEVLHSQGGQSLYRAGRTVHARYEDALEDAERRVTKIR